MRCRLALGLLLSLAACASSRPGGSEIDASGDDDVDAPEDTDGNGTPTDAPDIDGTAPPIDAAIDAAVDAPIDASTCPTSPCDLHQQCGCTSPLVCDIDFTDLMGTACRGVNQAGTETSNCTQGGTPQSSYCAGGYVCVGLGADASCKKYCDANSDCGQPRGQCVIQLTNGTMPIAGATTCSSNCNPMNSAAGGCPAGDKCGFFTANDPVLTGGQDVDIVDCTTPGAGAHGATCTNDTSCASDTFCTNVNSQLRCRRVCNRANGNADCAGLAGTTCIGFTMPLVVGGTEYGVCGP
jgi:hypothetical protein